MAELLKLLADYGGTFTITPIVDGGGRGFMLHIKDAVAFSPTSYGECEWYMGPHDINATMVSHEVARVAKALRARVEE